MLKEINGATFRKMIIASASLLDENKSFVDSLNVFPVPDGDTGTNMSLTLKSATNEVNNCVNNTIESLSEAWSKGALKGARGNSGVITSQILRGMCSVFCKQNTITTKIFAKALVEGCNVAYKAVTKPKEGTMLTIIKALADAAVASSKKTANFEDFFYEILEKGEDVLAQTPEMLPVLKKAGVVDAGGRGLIFVFTGFLRVAMNDETLVLKMKDSAYDYAKITEVHVNLEELAEIEFGYCTEFMIVNINKKTTEADIEKLKDKLMAIGDSVVCVGDLQLVKVHVHTNEPNLALGYALELGEIDKIKIENMREQNRELKRQQSQNKPLKEFGMVAVAPGSGFSKIFKDLTVDEIITGGQTMNPSAEDIAEAVDKVFAKNVFVFPNNKNIIMAAEQAKALSKRNIIVIPTKSVCEGISASLAFNSESTIEDNTEAMKESLINVKSGSVTYAVRSTHVDGFDLSVGEIIGLDDKAILTKGTFVSNTTEELIDKMVDDNIVNITLFYGEEIHESDAENLKNKIAEKYPDCEVTVLYGGQPVYYYIISLE